MIFLLDTFFSFISFPDSMKRRTLLSAPSLDARDWMRVVMAVTALLTRVMSASPSMVPDPCVPSTAAPSCRCCRNMEENCFNE